MFSLNKLIENNKHHIILTMRVENNVIKSFDKIAKNDVNFKKIWGHAWRICKPATAKIIDSQYFAKNDSGAATAYLCLEADSQDIGTCMLGV